jgi:hypothetical protein
MTTNPRLVATDCLDAVKRALAVKVLVVKAFMACVASARMARDCDRAREAISRVWITWFHTQQEIYQSMYRVSENYLSMPALSIRGLVCVAHGVSRRMYIGSGASSGSNVKIFSSGGYLFWRRD